MIKGGVMTKVRLEYKESESCPSMSRRTVMFVSIIGDDGQKIGEMKWNRNRIPRGTQDSQLELESFDMEKPCAHSEKVKVMGMIRKHVRKYYPKIKGLVAYSDSMHGSEIYVADGWFVAAKQNGTVKWVRSP